MENYNQQKYHRERFAHLRGSIYKPNVDRRTDGGQRPILKPHLSNQTKKCDFLRACARKTAPTPLAAIKMPPGKTNVLTKFHENEWAKNVTPRVENCPPPTGSHVFSPIWTIFELIRDINKTNVLIKKTAPPPGSHVFQRTGTIFELNSHWTKNVTSRVFTCFYYIHIVKTAPPLGGHFHDDWAKIVTFRVFTRKTAPPTGGHVFQRTGTTFKLNQHIIKTNILTNFELYRGIIGTNLLTKSHEDRTKNVASRTDGQRTNDGQRPIPKAHLSNQYTYPSQPPPNNYNGPQIK
ncbi:hypothetical protein DPMN_183527 [Dreissena polymorpha]|uniref:Uncharacterized protein n=1 Tax=Dreissena polymorpha TaxID=45954 RepID=A0A9D4I732_DREPO|nr:hypothetical protein DPMN_183527 [Dreissena polymorpha]